MEGMELSSQEKCRGFAVPPGTKREVERRGLGSGAGQMVLYPNANKKPRVLLPVARWGREGSEEERNRLCIGWRRGGGGGRGIFRK